jgi:UDP-glucoronosyl and UDP-glucosyl transferase
MPKEIVDTFIRVFSKLPQRVIWKWEAEIPENIPPNIMMVDWLPQQDLLGIQMINHYSLTRTTSVVFFFVF